MKGVQGKKKGGQRTELWSRAMFRDAEREKSVERIRMASVTRPKS